MKKFNFFGSAVLLAAVMFCFAACSDDSGDPILQSIAVTSKPDKTVYLVNDELNLDGLVVTAIYNNGSKSVIADYTINTDEYDETTIGSYKITVEYETKAAVFYVVVADIAEPIPMMAISGETFLMGNDDGAPREKPAFRATVKDFFIGVYAITQEQYQTVTGKNPSCFKDAKRPVESVSWYQAIVFCNTLSNTEGLTPVYSLNSDSNPSNWGTVPTNSDGSPWNNIDFDQTANGYRLPTSAEWEYACRAGTTSVWYIGDNSFTDNDVWILKTETTNVGNFPPNNWGLHDMIGNVGQWCWDWVNFYEFDGLQEYTYYRTNKNSGTVDNPLGTAKPPDDYLRRIWRGAAYNCNPNSETRFRRLQSAYYDRSDPAVPGSDLGFRIVRNN